MATAGGYAVGAAQDFNAHRLLARALNYEGDRLGVSPDFRGGTPVELVGLDADALRSQMTDSPFAPPAEGPGTPGAAVPGGTAPGTTALAPPAGARPPSRGAPPPRPTAPPTSSRPPACNPRTGTGSYDGQVTDAATGTGANGVTVTFYLDGCPVASGVTRNGKLDRFSAFLPNTTYTYTASGGGYATSSGSLTSAPNGHINTGIVVSQ